jgi:hypothetical protein
MYSVQTPLVIPIYFHYNEGKKLYSMFIKAYNEEKEVLAAEAEEFDFLITSNDLIVIIVIIFIKLFQGSKCCST